jgi:hypothetical protein
MNPAARALSRRSGTRTSDVARTPIRSANPPSPTIAITRSPGAQPSTPSPTAVMRPATSLPGTNGTGGLIWYRPWTKSAST